MQESAPYSQRAGEYLEHLPVAHVPGNVHWSEILLVTETERQDGLREGHQVPCQLHEVVVRGQVEESEPWNCAERRERGKEGGREEKE